MAKSLNSYAKTLVSEHHAITNLIHEHGGYEKERLTSAEVSSALKHPHAKLVHEMLNALSGYIRSFREQVDARSNLKEELHYLADAIPVIEIQYEQVFGEGRTKLAAILKEMQSEFDELMGLNTELNVNIEILQSALYELERNANQIDQSWQNFRHDMLEKILEMFDKQKMQLSDEDKKEWLQESGWGELIKQVRQEKLPMPKHLNFAKPDYTSYFELKRCIFLAHADKRKGKQPVAVNDNIHKDLQQQINDFGKRTDNVISIALGQFEPIFKLATDEAIRILKQCDEKHRDLLSLNERAMEAAQLIIPDTESIMEIAKRTIAKNIVLKKPVVEAEKPTMEAGNE